MNHTVLCIVFKTCHSPFMWGIVGNYICIIYIFIGVNGNEGVCRTFATFQVAPLRNHCNFSSCNPYEPLQFFMLHPLVSYKFRPPPPPRPPPPLPPFTKTNIFFMHLKNSDIAFSFLLSNSSSRVIHSVLCVRNLSAFEVPLHR